MFELAVCFLKKYLFTWVRRVSVAAHGVFNLCFGMIRKCVLAICLELTGWNRLARPASETGVVTAFHGSKMTANQTRVWTDTQGPVGSRRSLHLCSNRFSAG